MNFFIKDISFKPILKIFIVVKIVLFIITPFKLCGQTHLLTNAEVTVITKDFDIKSRIDFNETTTNFISFTSIVNNHFSFSFNYGISEAQEANNIKNLK